MARSRQQPPSGNDPNCERTHRMFQAGAPEFVEARAAHCEHPRACELRRGVFTDARVEARRMLFWYLERPRHEPLVNRLFKAADSAGDDAVMARFLHALLECSH